jgi:uncharacterized membrane protein
VKISGDNLTSRNFKLLQLIQNNYFVLALTIIVIIGAILRFKGLLLNSYWVDELYSISFSTPSYSLEKVFEETTVIDVHPPLYQTLLWIWFKLFGYTEFVGRSLSAIFGVLGVIAIYFLGKELFNKYVGLYASLIASMNDFLIHYSQETRSYTLLFLLTIISYLYFIRTINDPRKSNIILYWITTILMLYTHYITFFIVGTQVFVFVFYILKFPAKRKKLIVVAFLTALVYILSLLPILEYIPLDREEDMFFFIPEPSKIFFIKYIYYYFKCNVLFILFILAALMSLVYMVNRKIPAQEKNALILLLIWITAGFLLPYLESVLSTPMLHIRYTIYIVPAVILFVSYGIWRIGSWKREIFLSLVVFFSLYHLFNNYYSTIYKDYWREVLQSVNKYDPLPIYENVRHNGWSGDINLYQTYAKMLQLDMEIYNSKKLKQDLKNGRLPECFWVLDESIKKSSIIKNGLVHKVFEINHTLEGGFKSEGILYSYKIEPNICADRAGIKKEKQ